MTAAQLRASILQLAIEGRLVPQDPSDEPASVLLKRIAAEKARGLRAAKREGRAGALREGRAPSRPQAKGLPRITDDEKPFALPEGWEWCRLGDVVEVDSNLVPPAEYGTFKHVAPDNIEKCTGRLLPCRTVLEDKVMSPNHLFRKGTLLYSKIRPLLRKVVVAPFDGLCCADMYPLKTSLNVLYVQMFLLSDAYNRQVMERTSSRVKMPKINQVEMGGMLFPLPPLAEQKRIVAKVEELMPLVEKYAALEAKRLKLESDLPGALRKSILQDAIEGKLTQRDPNDEPASVLLKRIAAEKAKLVKAGKIKKEKPLPPITDDEKPFDLPEGWEWARWGSIAHSIQYGYNAPAKDSGRIKMVRISDVQGGQVMWMKVPFCDIAEDSIQDYLLKPRDILFARTGGTVGKSYLVKDVPYESVYAGYLIRTRYGGSLVPEYLKFFMEGELYWNQLRSGTTATAQPNCNGQTLSRMMLPLPPLAEQRRIVAKVEELLAAVERLKSPGRA